MKNNNKGFIPPNQRNIKNLTLQDITKLGLSAEGTKHVDTLNDLKKFPPNIVVGDCVKNITFIQNRFRKQTLKKKMKYVMSLGIYQQLHYDMERKTKILKPSKVKFKDIYRPYYGEDLSDKTLFVSRTGGLGDILFICPNLIYLKEKYPTCNIKFAVGPQYRAMLDTWECIDEIVDLPFGLNYMIQSDYHAFFEGVIERCKEAEVKNAYNLFSEWMGLNLDDELLIPKQTPKRDKVFECKKILKNKFNIKEKEFIILQMKASSPIRTPNIKWWLKVINELTKRGYNIVITDSPGESDGIDKFIENLNNTDKVFNFAKYSKSIDYCIAMTSLSNMSLSIDSSLIHIAASLGIKCFGVYGPFFGNVRLSTYKNVDWIDAKEKCAPCFTHGTAPCKKAQLNNLKHSPCYENIDIIELCNRVETLYIKEIE